MNKSLQKNTIANLTVCQTWLYIDEYYINIVLDIIAVLKKRAVFL